MKRKPKKGASRPRRRGKKRDWQRLYGTVVVELNLLRSAQEQYRLQLNMIEHFKRDAVRSRMALDEMQARLAAVLEPDQREAARISNVTEAEYAINLVRLCKEKLDDMKSWRGPHE